MRTSATHPLQIATVSPKAGMGRVGITFCPGKRQPHAATGAWDRQLDLDLDALAAWGAVAVVSLVESSELTELGVPNLGAEVAARHMDWLHLPIPDFSTPSAKFEAAWRSAGEDIRGRLRAGFDIVVHCKGGLGRAGMIGARLMAELGVSPDQAVAEVRAARPGAIETAAQLEHVLTTPPVPEVQPATSFEAIRDRAVGSLLGLAMGDAVGTTLEFRSRDSYPYLTDMIGGGPFGLKPGEWTDDTAMALALADSLAANPELDPKDLMTRFSDWWRKGVYSCTGRCFDIGITTRQAIGRWEKSGDPYAGSTDPMTAGNGSLMRLAPVAIRHYKDRAKLRDVAARQSRATHAASEAVDACVAYAELLADAIEGAQRSAVLAPRAGFTGKVGACLAGGWRGKARRDVRATGYVLHSLDAALWSLGASPGFRGAVLRAANLGEDADTTAAITGQLAGALAGTTSLPSDWLTRLAWAPRIRGIAETLL
ncbi:ADP-ribosylglycohydrolase family protein [Defluviimonas sp. WL0024]|uniref:ADP-ribosylglycohydrolase family protein n=1 Tax=Albidovulum salinarum TaxID=2984153 RepID=A0ABT2WYH1_9RHOB|nr:ADP-ribosylglycohydrolase family protein [Defluviimonas sp. WL0024]MCU9846726.1 ADP-ribosylglycohydrolase family protein [Defluviimonas sp. WL0024]